MKYLYGSAVMASALASAQADNTNMLVQNAMEMIGRATSTSEVLTLNLTSLFLLILVKIIIIALNVFASGAVGRSSNDNEMSLTESEMNGGMCFIMYSAGDDTKLSCVQRAACMDPKTAEDYAAAAKMWYKMSKVLGLKFNSKNFEVLEALEEATSHSLSGGECDVYAW